MSNWTRTYGTDQYGRRSIIITEENSKPKTPLGYRLNIALMKLVFFGGLAVLMPLALMVRCCAGA